jgi:hypothetical protein
MKLFTEDSSLQSMNEVLGTHIPKYSLIGDIPLSEKDFQNLASNIGILYRKDGNHQFNLKYKECLAVFLVFCAVYEYDKRTFWQPIEKYLGALSYNRRMDLSSAFSDVLYKYNLNHFEHESEEGFTYVTPILCHAGIPINAFDNFFAAISNTVNDSFYDDFDVDDYLSYLKNKTEITLKRYLKLTNRRDAYNFIQNSRKLILNDSVDNDDELDNGNYLRMFEQISYWKEKPKVKKNLQARSNVQITAPKIKLDLDGVGVYCELPRIVVKDSYDSYIIWEISSDETITNVKSDFFRRSGVLVSEEKIITLRPAFSYSINLKVDNILISKWEFEGIKENYIAFTQNGNIIKTEGPPNSLVTLLLNKNMDIIDKEELSISELPQIPLWNEYNVFRIDLSNLKILKCTGFNIQVHSENKPIIEGGKTLFNQENSRAFIELPYIKVPIINEGEWHLEIKHKSGSNVISKSNEVVAPGCVQIPLSPYIQKECYGEYDIKLWNRAGFNGKFYIEYVPSSKILVDKNEYWPSSYQGYLNNIQLIHVDRGVEIEIFNAEKVAAINHGDHFIYRYIVNDRDRFLIGEYKYAYNGNIFSTSIKKSIHPISWGIIGLENEIIDLSSRVYTLTLKDFSNATDPYLLFAFDFNLVDCIQCLKFDLIGANQEVLYSNNISIINKDGLRIPLNTYLFEVQNTTAEIDYQLHVSLFDSNEICVSSFLVARIQEEVVIKNAQYIQNEHDILITWEEMGTRNGRECVLVNFLKPWLKPYHFKIPDKMCEMNINSKQLEKGIYKYLIQKETEDLFLDEVEEEICTLKDFQKGRIVVKGEHIYSSDMERILYHILKSRFMKKEYVPKKLEQIEVEISSLQVKVPEDIRFLSYAYILHEKFIAVKEDTPIVMNLFEALFNLLSGSIKETTRFVLESDFSTQYKRKLLHKFYCINLTSVTRFNEMQLNLLADIDEDMAGLINLIESEHNTRGLNWAGISDIEVLREEDLFGEGDSKSTFLSDENLGKSSYIAEYFQYVYSCLQRPKNISKRTEEFLRDFQKDHSVKETMIFGKTRLHLLVDWKEKNRDSKTIQDRLADIIYIPCKEELREQFDEAFRAITKRKEEDELGYYLGLIALYASFIRNGLMQERKEFSRLLHYVIEKCGKLYYRDALVIELYMRLERGLSWV